MVVLYLNNHHPRGKKSALAWEVISSQDNEVIDTVKKVLADVVFKSEKIQDEIEILRQSVEIGICLLTYVRQSPKKRQDEINIINKFGRLGIFPWSGRLRQTLWVTSC